MYPAFFLLVRSYEGGVEIVYVKMLCLALLLRRPHAWDMSIDRVCNLVDVSYTAILQDAWGAHPGWQF